MDFVFGTQYLRGFSPDPADWEHDLEHIAGSGFNTIRVWLVWGVLEVREGEIDFAYLDRILSCAEKKNLRTILLFHLHGAPEYLIRKYPQFRYVDRAGLPFEPSARSNTPSGGWPGLCPDNPEVQRLEERFIREIVMFAGKRAYGFEPVNEPHMWIDPAGSRVNEYCYCPATREAFRRYLQQKYGSLETLSRAWGRRFDCWESVRPPTWIFGYADQVDFREFTMENVAALVRRRAAVIRKYTDRPVFAHAWGGGSNSCPQLGAMAFDDWRNAAEVESWGCSAFPERVEATPRLAQSMDATRSAADGKPFWQSELSAGNTGGGTNFSTPVPPELLAGWCWTSVFHGAKGLLFWQYRTEIFGNESGFFSLTDRTGKATDRLIAVEKFGRTVAEYENLFMSAQTPPAEVAILFSPRAFLLDWAIHRNNQFSCDATAGYYDAFYHANIPVDFLHVHQLNPERLRRYKLVILPATFTLARDTADLLTAYVADGGALLADPFTASWEGDLKLSRTMPGTGLDQLFGVQEREFRSSGKELLSLQGKTHSYFLPARFPYEIWQQQSERASAFATVNDDEWILSEHPYGCGRAFLSGIPLGNLDASGGLIADDLHADFQKVTCNDAAAMILDVAAQCDISATISTAAPLHVRRLLLPEDGELLLFSNQSAFPTTQEVVSPSRSKFFYKGIFGLSELVFSLEGRGKVALPPFGNAVFLKSKE